jgi:hypothetical protein
MWKWLKSRTPTFVGIDLVMHPDQFSALPERTDGADIAEVETEFLDPRYRLDVNPVSTSLANGLLVLFTLVPSDSGLLGFRARWDHKEDAIDLDPYPAGCISRGKWLREGGSYIGHHTLLVSAEPVRIYRIEVRVPGVDVFRGFLRLNLRTGLKAAAEVCLEARAEAEIIRGGVVVPQEATV